MLMRIRAATFGLLVVSLAACDGTVSESNQTSATAAPIERIAIEPTQYNPCPSDDGGICKTEQDQLKKEWPAARRGNYQAQRNVAYSFHNQKLGRMGGFDADVQACAWRLVIIKNDDPAVDESDRLNLNSDCGRLDSRQMDRAQRVAQLILAQQP